MARAGLCLTLGLLSCGLIHKDVDIVQEFLAGPNLPAEAQVDLAGPLVSSQGDLAHLSAVTMRAARIEATDGASVGFISGATLTLGAPGLPDLKVATLPLPSTTARADLTVDSTRDLKPYLVAGSKLTAKLTYSPTPPAVRTLRLTITVRGSL